MLHDWRSFSGRSRLAALMDRKHFEVDRRILATNLWYPLKKAEAGSKGKQEAVVDRVCVCVLILIWIIFFA